MATSMLLNILPYWLLGAAVILGVYKSEYKDSLRIEKPALLGFLKFISIVTVYRILFFKLFPDIQMLKDAANNISIIPPFMTLGVFWEDACHGLPLFLLGSLLEKKQMPSFIYKIAMFVMMLEFGMGHVYQGLPAAIMLSFYLPYSVKAGKKYGFGTVMVCHSIFDFATIMAMKLFLGH